MSSKTLKGSGKNKEVLFLIAVPLRGGGRVLLMPFILLAFFIFVEIPTAGLKGRE